MALKSIIPPFTGFFSPFYFFWSLFFTLTHKVIAKNKQLRLAAAKKTVARLETQTNEDVRTEN
jgi:hypothetical protein